MPYCHKCGAEIDEDASFCPKCGSKMKRDRETESIETGENEEPEKSQKVSKEEKGDKKTEKKMAEPIGLLIGGFILIAIGIFFNSIVTGALGGMILWFLFFVTIGVLILVGIAVAILTSVFSDFRKNGSE